MLFTAGTQCSGIFGVLSASPVLFQYGYRPSKPGTSEEGRPENHSLLRAIKVSGRGANMERTVFTELELSAGGAFPADTVCPSWVLVEDSNLSCHSKESPAFAIDPYGI